MFKPMLMIRGTLPKREQMNKLCDSPRGLVAKPMYRTIDVANFFTLIFTKKPTDIRVSVNIYEESL